MVIHVHLNGMIMSVLCIVCSSLYDITKNRINFNSSITMVSRPNLAEDSTLYAIAQKLDEPRAYSVINHCAAEQWHPRLTFTVF